VAFAAFFVVIALFVTRLPLGWAFAVAAAVALVMNGITLRVVILQPQQRVR
jgi:hypothetical protein